MLCKENQRTFQPKPPDDQGLTKPFWHETFHIRELSIRTIDAVKGSSSAGLGRPRRWHRARCKLRGVLFPLKKSAAFIAATLPHKRWIYPF
jgi:hypothetical protein